MRNAYLDCHYVNDNLVIFRLIKNQFKLHDTIYNLKFLIFFFLEQKFLNIKS